MDEAQLWEHNEYVTLTYDPENLPPDLNLVHRHYVLFQKRLVNHFARLKQNAIDGRPNYKLKNRYYMSGEYGEENGRPHYHAILFNTWFEDRKYHCKTDAGAKLYTSELLTRLWGLGFASTGDVTWESAAYVARYVMKKINEKGKTKTENKYREIINPETGEIIKRIQPYSQMSRSPGIGKKWIEKYAADVYPHGLKVVNGHEIRPPRYYDEHFKKLHPQKYKQLSAKRAEEGLKKFDDNTNTRLNAKEIVTDRKLTLLKRKI